MITMQQARDMRHGISLQGSRCQCAECGQVFRSTAAFDRHRTGPMSARVCLKPDEMEAIGMMRNGAGHWITERMPDAVHESRETSAPA